MHEGQDRNGKEALGGVLEFALMNEAGLCIFIWGNPVLICEHTTEIPKRNEMLLLSSIRSLSSSISLSVSVYQPLYLFMYLNAPYQTLSHHSIPSPHNHPSSLPFSHPSLPKLRFATAQSILISPISASTST